MLMAKMRITGIENLIFTPFTSGIIHYNFTWSWADSTLRLLDRIASKSPTLTGVGLMGIQNKLS
jgi:hypothetical protein